MSTLVEIRNLVKAFPVKTPLLRRTVGEVRAVDDVSLRIEQGETVGLVGESGCGKSTLGRMLVHLLEPSAGEIRFDGRDLTHLDQKSMRSARRDVQIIFQDPYSSLDPRATVGASIAEGLLIHGMRDPEERYHRVGDMLRLVGLQPGHAERFPHEFSGGQRQRIGIARALILRPRFVVCDEPVSALDVSVQAQVLNLLKELQRDLDLTLLFISHNLAVVEYISDRVAVMYLGRLVELTTRDELYRNPRHPYTKALLSAIPIPDPERERDRVQLTGELPSPMNPPAGCTFHPRCPLAFERCRTEVPKALTSGATQVACHAVEESSH